MGQSQESNLGPRGQCKAKYGGAVRCATVPHSLCQVLSKAFNSFSIKCVHQLSLYSQSLLGFRHDKRGTCGTARCLARSMFMQKLQRLSNDSRWYPCSSQKCISLLTSGSLTVIELLDVRIIVYKELWSTCLWWLGSKNDVWFWPQAQQREGKLMFKKRTRLEFGESTLSCNLRLVGRV